ncbi:hypothetical protein ABZP36_032989 [Zizania latifolia]
MRGRRLPHAAGVLLLWLAVLTFAFHWCGRRRIHQQPAAFHLPTRKMLLTVPPTFDASSSSSSPSLSPTTTTDRHQQHHRDGRHNRHHSHHHHGHQHTHHRGVGGGIDRWNRHGVPSPAGPGDEVDPRFGVQKRLVPTGPNPLHH